jgi:hypothetical protein
MPRPMYLIQETLLTTLTEEATLGVPVKTLVRKYSLAITAQTLSKLIKLKQELDLTGNETIRLSLFPTWLNTPLAKQPTTHKYDGQFPNGKWILAQ